MVGLAWRNFRSGLDARRISPGSISWWYEGEREADEPKPALLTFLERHVRQPAIEVLSSFS